MWGQLFAKRNDNKSDVWVILVTTKKRFQRPVSILESRKLRDIQAGSKFRMVKKDKLPTTILTILQRTREANGRDGCRDVSHMDAMILHVIAQGHLSKLRKDLFVAKVHNKTMEV